MTISTLMAHYQQLQSYAGRRSDLFEQAIDELIFRDNGATQINKNLVVSREPLPKLSVTKHVRLHLADSEEQSRCGGRGRKRPADDLKERILLPFDRELRNQDYAKHQYDKNARYNKYLYPDWQTIEHVRSNRRVGGSHRTGRAQV
jgi:hypothetical protein